MVRTVQTLLHSRLACNEMQASARTSCGRHAALRQHDRKCRLKSSQAKSIYFNHPSQGNSTNYYLILRPRDKAAPPTSQQINKFPPKRINCENSSDTVIHLYFNFFLLHRRALLSASQMQCSSNRANVPRTC